MALNELNILRAKLKELQNYRSKDLAEFEMRKKVWEAEKKGLNERLDNYKLGKKVLEDEKKALTERLDKELSNFAAKLKEVLESLSKSNAELERTCQERDGYRNNLELRKKEWEDEKKALTERLNTAIINFGAELKQVLKNLSKSEAELEKTSKERDTCKNSLELGNKVWEAERIEMAKKIEMANKEKQNALELGKKLADAQRTETAESIALVNKERRRHIAKGTLTGG